MHESGEPNSTDLKLTFAWRNFDNQQALIRAADTKAGFLLTLVLFLAATTLPIGKEATSKLRWVPGGGALTSAVYLVSYGILAAGFVRSLFLISEVLTPRLARHYTSPTAGSHLLYWQHVILHQDNIKYFESLSNASAELLLRNVTDQVFELAHICQVKMAGLGKARSSFNWAFSGWFLNTAIGLWIASWK